MPSRLSRLVGNQLRGEPLIQVGRIVSISDGAYSVIVNGRGEARRSTAATEFALNGQGHGEGDEVLIKASSVNDTPVIIGHSPWLLNQIGTAYDE